MSRKVFFFFLSFRHSFIVLLGCGRLHAVFFLPAIVDGGLEIGAVTGGNHQTAMVFGAKGRSIRIAALN